MWGANLPFGDSTPLPIGSKGALHSVPVSELAERAENRRISLVRPHKKLPTSLPLLPPQVTVAKPQQAEISSVFCCTSIPPLLTSLTERHIIAVLCRVEEKNSSSIVAALLPSGANRSTILTISAILAVFAIPEIWQFSNLATPAIKQFQQSSYSSNPEIQRSNSNPAIPAI